MSIENIAFILCSLAEYYESQSLEILGVFVSHTSLLVFIPVVYREYKLQDIQVQSLNTNVESQGSCAASESTGNLYFTEGTSCESFRRIS